MKNQKKTGDICKVITFCWGTVKDNQKTFFYPTIGWYSKKDCYNPKRDERFTIDLSFWKFVFCFNWVDEDIAHNYKGNRGKIFVIL